MVQFCSQGMNENLAKTPVKTQNSGLRLKSKNVLHPKICNWEHCLIFDKHWDQSRMAFRFLSTSKT